MIAYVWQHDRQAISNRWAGEPGALLMWATWIVDSLYYLAELDTRFGLPNGCDPHDWGVIDLAHARWAAGSAVGAIDLCCAALARREGLGPIVTKRGKELEFDVADADRAADEGKLTADGAAWARAVANDPDVGCLTAIRHPTTHSRLLRHFSRGGPGGASDRTRLEVDGDEMQIAAIVELARATATRVVEDFLDQIEKGVL